MLLLLCMWLGAPEKHTRFTVYWEIPDSPVETTDPKWKLIKIENLYDRPCVPRVSRFPWNCFENRPQRSCNVATIIDWTRGGKNKKYPLAFSWALLEVVVEWVFVSGNIFKVTVSRKANHEDIIIVLLRSDAELVYGKLWIWDHAW